MNSSQLSWYNFMYFIQALCTKNAQNFKVLAILSTKGLTAHSKEHNIFEMNNNTWKKQPQKILQYLLASSQNILLISISFRYRICYIAMHFCRQLIFFSKWKFSKNSFRSMFCRAWSGSKLFAKVISSWGYNIKLTYSTHPNFNTKYLVDELSTCMRDNPPA